MTSANIALAALTSVVLAASAAAAASTEAHITYAAVDAWDPVVLLDIGTRNVNEVRGDQWSDGSPLSADLSSQSGSGAMLMASAQASVGALHVSSAADFGGQAAPGDLRSANFNAYAGWSDTLTPLFAPHGAQDGYAYIDLLVTGDTTIAASPQGAGGLAFARTYAGISVTGYNAYDTVRTTIASLDNLNYVTRQVIIDPNYVGDADHFDPDRGQYFSETLLPGLVSVQKFFEGGSDYFPDPSLVSGSDFTTINGNFSGTFQVRVPFADGVPTYLDVRIMCESYGGAEPGDSGGGACDMSHSVYWGGVDHVTDLNGNVLSGVGVNSASGFDYSQSYFGQPAAVPEPSAWALLIGGLGLAGGALRRRSEGWRVLSARRR